jgi:hypothetical protein
MIKQIVMTEEELKAVIAIAKEESYKKGIIDAGNQYKEIMKHEKEMMKQKFVSFLKKIQVLRTMESSFFHN